MRPLSAGDVFAKAYEIVRPISAGGMGVVYEVIHLGTRRRRALKVMLAHIVSDPRMRERFSLEAVVTADIESESLTEIFDAGIDAESDCPYLVMELLRGEDLGARLKRRERTPADETLLMMDQVCRALEKTHAKGVIHRDLKPDNLFVTVREDGSRRVKILDFGIAKLVKQDTTGGPQATTKTFGTPYYMAREQITGESALISPGSDLYAIAHIVFALLTGRPYFEDEARATDGNVLALLMAVGRGATEAASERALRRGVELPKAFDAWFARATAIKPTDRFGTARLFMDGLREALRESVRIVGVDPDAPPREAVSATSDRAERSFPKASDSQISNPEILHQTGGPQSITAQVPQLPSRKSSRVALLFAVVALVGCALGVAAWRLSLSSRPEPTVGASANAELPSTALATAAQPTVDAALASAAPADGATSASATTVEASASAAASSAVVPTARPISAKPLPGPTAAPVKGEVWETR